jgi:hypothetical protein
MYRDTFYSHHTAQTTQAYERQENQFHLNENGFICFKQERIEQGVFWSSPIVLFFETSVKMEPSLFIGSTTLRMDPDLTLRIALTFRS